ncbi:flavin reductase family protein [Rhizobium sp. C4]|uniref:flavin reductase family protein n=1 Tax=Rhizobium sp. C4 TaxID=1349800 RepID=UPI001E545F89|nr:flavin reductase family protein [Rhizobium sp. C4]MCD2172542.1 flavin reductase family protein [Rhizobium sp. C4]
MTRGRKANSIEIPKRSADVDTPASGTDFKRALRQIASPVAIVTAANGGDIGGLTATTFCSVSSDPPTFLVCLNKGSAVAGLIDASGQFAVNLLADEQHAIARSFSGPESGTAALFSKSGWSSLLSDAPVLDDAVACLDCDVESRVDAGSHNLYLGRVRAISTAERDVLLYRDGLFRRLQPAG